ncbi:hypothetical protein Cch01nite_39330 [Cellulomonas chitinilytica]|uniref:Activator of Hsp90 ATPase homologue 1/2-like C-terminal domain-containing protein n=1 Tax=Cellulomonas chitinilytica TaxID=398759 RepID=A0A919P8H2_9CELL|nr:SRPBCC domain-containing protein [Cellulomonas chitinilytica]GIG23209.1 hypothetical protein Cch01nite_39330 [Cellulomonas chitinilytica]
MAREFEIVREIDVDADPQAVWDAVTTANAAWLWPMDFEPRVGGAVSFGGTVVAWDPPHQVTGRHEGPDGWFNEVSEEITPLDGGRSRLRWTHTGVFAEDWDRQHEGAAQHTDFYLHTLTQYLAHFRDRTATYSSVDAPEASNNPGALEWLLNRLGLAGLGEGDVTVTTLVHRVERVDVDYVRPHFVGLRTDHSLIRLFGRNAFGSPVGVAIHDFAEGADAETTTARWTEWLEHVYS